jgi:transcriptional regulator with XRE-family HTH domain
VIEVNGKKIYHPLKLARMKAGMKQIDLARAVGVSESQVAKWETGRAEPNPIYAERLTNVLGIGKEELSRYSELQEATR